VTGNVHKSSPILKAPVAAAVLLVTGCGSPSTAPAEITEQLHAAIAHQDAAAACATLSAATRSMLEHEEQAPCQDTILEQDLPNASGTATAHAQVFGSMAQVSYPGETVFLSRYSNGWRVTAAGCTPMGRDRPYECTLTAN